MPKNPKPPVEQDDCFLTDVKVEASEVLEGEEVNEAEEEVTDNGNH